MWKHCSRSFLIVSSCCLQERAVTAVFYLSWCKALPTCLLLIFGLLFKFFAVWFFFFNCCTFRAFSSSADFLKFLS